MKTETPRETAEQIANDWHLRDYVWTGVTTAIEAALTTRDQRAVQIVNQFSVCRDHDQPSHCVHCDLRHKAIAAIRGKQ